MELKDVVSIAGKPGLNLIVGKRPNGLIVETIDAQKKRFPTSLSQKVSILEDISIYTAEGDKRLMEVLILLHEQASKGLALINKKDSGDEIRSFFKKVLPDFDEARVYNSDIIKLVNWYTILKDHMDFTEDKSEVSEEGAESKTVKGEKTAKPKTPKNQGTTKKVSTKSAPAKAPKLTQRKMS